MGNGPSSSGGDASSPDIDYDQLSRLVGRKLVQDALRTVCVPIETTRACTQDGEVLQARLGTILRALRQERHKAEDEMNRARAEARVLKDVQTAYSRLAQYVDANPALKLVLGEACSTSKYAALEKDVDECAGRLQGGGSDDPLCVADRGATCYVSSFTVPDARVQAVVADIERELHEHSSLVLKAQRAADAIRLLHGTLTKFQAALQQRLDGVACGQDEARAAYTLLRTLRQCQGEAAKLKERVDAVKHASSAAVQHTVQGMERMQDGDDELLVRKDDAAAAPIVSYVPPPVANEVDADAAVVRAVVAAGSERAGGLVDVIESVVREVVSTAVSSASASADGGTSAELQLIARNPAYLRGYLRTVYETLGEDASGRWRKLVHDVAVERALTYDAPRRVRIARRLMAADPLFATTLAQYVGILSRKRGALAGGCIHTQTWRPRRR